MEESLGYSASEVHVTNESIPGQPSQWQFRSSSAFSLGRNSSTLFVQYEDFHLHLVQKKSKRNGDRPVIPATLHDRLSFYRNYVASSPSKTLIFCMQHTNYERFFWNYVFTTLFKSVPHTYAIVFLASYAPAEHLFIPKMVPILYGSKYTFIFSAMLELYTYIDNCVFLASYTIRGLLYTNPWNRCSNGNAKIGNTTYKCYEVDKFAQKIRQGNWTFGHGLYATNSGEYFQVVQNHYLRKYLDERTDFEVYGLFTIIWLLAAIFQKQIYNSNFWKTLTFLQTSVMIFDAISFTYIVYAYYNEELYNAPFVDIKTPNITRLLWRADVDMLAESMTTPPVLHLITARSNEEIEPSRDSTIIILSNALLYIFKGLLLAMMKSYCEKYVGCPINFSTFNQLSWYYMWPLFFSLFYLGDLFTLGYLILNLLMEFLTITATYGCFVETIIWEWTIIKRWMITIALLFTIAPVMYITSEHILIEFNIHFKVLVTLTEVFALYCLYPLGRLVDDITFHTGEAPSRLRILNMRIVPIFYTIKTYYLITSFIQALQDGNHLCLFYIFSKYSWVFVHIPYVIGGIYVICLYLFNRKYKWSSLFVPHENWGPLDSATRELRKQYESRNYIGFQAPRPLSRYMLSRAESRSYHLDLQYDPNRGTTVPLYRMGGEKKNK